MTSEPRHLELVPPPTGISADQAEQVFAHLAVMARRAGLLTDMITAAAGRDPVWQQVREALTVARDQITRAQALVPGALEALTEAARTVTVGRLVVDTDARRAWLAGTPVTLSRKEMDVLVYMARTPNRAITAREFLRVVWGFQAHGRSRTVDSHISRLRKALQAHGAAPGEFVVNHWGAGWSLVAGDRDDPPPVA